MNSTLILLKPPVGDLRLRVPHSINSTFSSVISATDYVPECVGYGVSITSLYPIR